MIPSVSSGGQLAAIEAGDCRAASGLSWLSSGGGISKQYESSGRELAVIAGWGLQDRKRNELAGQWRWQSATL